MASYSASTARPSSCESASPSPASNSAIRRVRIRPTPPRYNASREAPSGIGAPAPSPSTWASKMAKRVWKAHGLQPHRLETFKLSRDKQFVEKRGRSNLNTGAQRPGLRPQPARTAPEKGLPADPRLQTTWHNDAVRRLQCARRPGDRGLSAATSAPGIPQIPTQDRPRNAAGAISCLQRINNLRAHSDAKRIGSTVPSATTEVSPF